MHEPLVTFVHNNYGISIFEDEAGDDEYENNTFSFEIYDTNDTLVFSRVDFETEDEATWAARGAAAGLTTREQP